MMTDQDTPLSYVIHAEDGTQQFRPDVSAFGEVPIAPMYLTTADFDSVARTQTAERSRRIGRRILADFPAELAGRSLAYIEKPGADALLRFGAFGFRKHAHLHFFAVWTVLCGLEFEEYDTAGKLQKVCRSDAPEDERLRAFRKSLDAFTSGA